MDLTTDQKYHKYASAGDHQSLKDDHAAGHKIEFNSRDSEGNSLLILASQAGSLETVEFILSVPEVDVDLLNFWGNSSLYVAALSGHYDAVQSLIKAGAKVNQTNKRGLTPLYGAVMNQHQRIVECLITHGSQLDMVLPRAIRERIKSLNKRKIVVDSKVIVTEPYNEARNGMITRDRLDGSYDVKYEDGRIGLDIDKEFIALDDSEGEIFFHDDGQLAIIECLLVNGANVNEIDQDTTGTTDISRILFSISEH